MSSLTVKTQLSVLAAGRSCDKLAPVKLRWRVFAALAFVAAVHGASDQALDSIKACRLAPVEWADGDSFRVRFPDGREETVRLYGADCMEWHVNDETDALVKSPPAAGLDPNTASRDELMLLPGVGEVIAKRIIEGRGEGAYSSPQDLIRIRGISVKTLESISPALRFTKPSAGRQSPVLHD